MDSSQINTLVLVIVGLLAFLVVRRFWLWFWNLSAILQALHEQTAATRELHSALKVNNAMLGAIFQALEPQNAVSGETTSDPPPPPGTLTANV